MDSPTLPLALSRLKLLLLVMAMCSLQSMLLASLAVVVLALLATDYSLGVIPISPLLGLQVQSAKLVVSLDRPPTWKVIAAPGRIPWTAVAPC